MKSTLYTSQVSNLSGKPNQNAFVERFNRSFRDEVLNANLFNSVDQAQEAADDWVQDYNEFRPHESLGDVAPMEFMPRKFVVVVNHIEQPKRSAVFKLVMHKVH